MKFNCLHFLFFSHYYFNSFFFSSSVRLLVLYLPWEWRESTVDRLSNVGENQNSIFALFCWLYFYFIYSSRFAFGSFIFSLHICRCTSFVLFRARASNIVECHRKNVENHCWSYWLLYVLSLFSVCPLLLHYQLKSFFITFFSYSVRVCRFFSFIFFGQFFGYFFFLLSTNITAFFCSIVMRLPNLTCAVCDIC